MSINNQKLKLPGKCRSISSFPKNPINVLQYREIGGIHRCHRRSIRSEVFHKLPGRLAFSLTSLVSQSVLDDGHVFLGFSRNGQFVLSYTLNLEAADHAPLPTNMYKLQFWQFVPYRRLRRVAEIRLFGEEDVQQELFLSVCEWPSLPDRIVIHGYSVSNVADGDEKRHCYVTIAAMPSPTLCDRCCQVAQLYSHNEGFNTQPRCLRHTFAIHTRYEVAPPYPPFVPHMSLACSGVLVVNTGDSLVAVGALVDDADHTNSLMSSVLIGDNCSSSCASSIANCDDLGDEELPVVLDSLSTAQSPAAPIPVVASPATPIPVAVSPAAPIPVVPSPSGMSSVSYRSASESSSTPKDTTNTTSVEQTRFFRERHLSLGKENQLKIVYGSVGSPAIASSSPTSHEQPSTACRPSNPSRCHDVYNFDCGIPKSSGEENGEFFEPQLFSLRISRLLRSTHCANRRSSPRLHSGSDSGSESNDGGNTVCRPFDDFCEPTVNVLDISPSSFQPSSHLTIAPLRLLDVGGMYPSFGTWGASPGRATNSTCSSCLSSPIILQNTSQCFTYSVRRFVTAHYQQGGADVEDDMNLAYHSLLPMEVHGTDYCSMKLVTKPAFLPHTPYVTVKQLTFDVEHYLGEAVKTCADWGHRYLAFTDYDVQIIEVCSDTAEVLAVVYVLIRARPSDDIVHHKHHGTRSIPKMYLTAFKLVWNLITGSYKTLNVKDLVEVNQAQIMRNRWNWAQWGRQLSDAIHRRFAVPLSHDQVAHVLTNEAVFRGQSLKMLLDRQHYVAILL